MIRLLADFSPHPPAYGLALEEAIFDAVRNGSRDTLRLWVNERAVIIGRSQSIAAEIDLAQARSLAIPVLRRISGGGTVYHYPGNLNVSLTLGDGRSLGRVGQTFRACGEALARGLGELASAITVRENSLFVGDKKIAGAAQARRGDALLYHSTLLVKPDTIPMERLLCALNRDYRPIGVASRPHPTTTLAEASDQNLSLEEIGPRITAAFCRLLCRPAAAGSLTDDENKRAERLAAEKYGSVEWNHCR